MKGAVLRGSLCLWLLAGLPGCATVAAPAQITEAWLGGVWAAETVQGWRYTLTVQAGQGFSQRVQSPDGTVCGQEGALWLDANQLHMRFVSNGCNEDFVGVTEAFVVQAETGDAFLVDRPGVSLRFRRVR